MKGKNDFFKTLRLLFVAFGFFGLQLGFLLGSIVGNEVGGLSKSGYMYWGILVLFFVWGLYFFSKKANSFIQELEDLV